MDSHLNNLKSSLLQCLPLARISHQLKLTKSQILDQHVQVQYTDKDFQTFSTHLDWVTEFIDPRQIKQILPSVLLVFHKLADTRVERQIQKILDNIVNLTLKLDSDIDVDLAHQFANCFDYINPLTTYQFVEKLFSRNTLLMEVFLEKLDQANSDNLRLVIQEFKAKSRSSGRQGTQVKMQNPRQKPEIRVPSQAALNASAASHKALIPRSSPKQPPSLSPHDLKAAFILQIDESMQQLTQKLQQHTAQLISKEVNAQFKRLQSRLAENLQESLNKVKEQLDTYMESHIKPQIEAFIDKNQQIRIGESQEYILEEGADEFYQPPRTQKVPRLNLIESGIVKKDVQSFNLIHAQIAQQLLP